MKIYSGNKWKPYCQYIDTVDGVIVVEGQFERRSEPMKGGHTHNHKKNAELKSKEHNKAARQTARLVWLWKNNRDVKFRFKALKKWKHAK